MDGLKPTRLTYIHWALFKTNIALDKATTASSSVAFSSGRK